MKKPGICLIVLYLLMKIVYHLLLYISDMFQLFSIGWNFSNARSQMSCNTLIKCKERLGHLHTALADFLRWRIEENALLHLVHEWQLRLAWTSTTSTPHHWAKPKYCTIGTSIIQLSLPTTTITSSLPTTMTPIWLYHQRWPLALRHGSLSHNTRTLVPRFHNAKAQ